MLTIMLPAKWLDLMLPQLSQFISPSTITYNYQGHGGTGDSALAAARRFFCPFFAIFASYSSPFPVASFLAFFRCQEILIREMGGPRLLTFCGRKVTTWFHLDHESSPWQVGHIAGALATRRLDGYQQIALLS